MELFPFIKRNARYGALALTLLVAAAASQVTALATTLDDGLVAYYQFSGNTYDSTSNHNDGTGSYLTGTSDRFGTASSAYHFNGSDSEVSFPDSVFGLAQMDSRSLPGLKPIHCLLALSSSSLIKAPQTERLLFLMKAEPSTSA